MKIPANSNQASTQKLVPMSSTIYQYTCIALVALMHLLDDDPRHVRYRREVKNHKHSGGREVEGPGNIRKQHSDGALDGSARRGRKQGKQTDEQLRKRPDVGADMGLKANEKRDAWRKIRSVTTRKKVHWGGESIIPPNYMRPAPQYRSRSKADERVRSKERKKEIWTTRPDEKVWNTVPGEKVWGPVNGEMGIWGPCE